VLPPLVVESLGKRFGAITALDGVSFEVRRGECFGLLGPNGAGKTTLLSIVATLLRPDGGRALVAGADVMREPEAARRFLGLAPQSLSLYDKLTAQENLQFFGRLWGLRGARLAERVGQALKLAQLEDRGGDRVGTFSGGMKRRLNFAVGLIHEPELLLLDEPTAGVDPQSRNHLFEMVEALAERGTTVVYTTHYMEEAERLCDRIAIIDHGKLVGLGTQEELRALAGSKDQAEVGFAPGTKETAVRAAFEGLDFALAEDRAVVTLPGGGALQDVFARCSRHGVVVRALNLRAADLEGVFLALTGRELRD
jgi:ABC-2 type transport system ATP-binding protein